MEKVIITCVIVIFIILCRAMKQDWSSPAVINVLWNSFFVFFAVVIFGDNIKWKYGGIIWMVLSWLFFFVGQIIGEKIEHPKKDNDSCDKEKTNLAQVVIICMILVSMLNPLIYLRAYGYSIHSLFNIRTLLVINNTIAVDRYSGGGLGGGIITVIGAIAYCSALCGGYMFIWCKGIFSKLLMIATLLPTIILTMITSGKIGTIAVVFLWIIGWVIACLEEKQTGIEISKKFSVLILSGGSIAFLILYLSMMLRIGTINAETKMIVDNKMQIYAFGQIQAFTEWFSRLDVFRYELGSNTFMVIARGLGLVERQQGVYGIIRGVVTNIFTQNRGIIQDFGIFGGLIYWGCSGIVAGWCYKGVKVRSQYGVLNNVLLATVYFAILYGFVISPWIYTSYIVAFLGFAGFVYFLDKMKINIMVRDKA